MEQKKLEYLYCCLLLIDKFYSLENYSLRVRLIYKNSIKYAPKSVVFKRYRAVFRVEVVHSILEILNIYIPEEQRRLIQEEIKSIS